MKKLLYFLLLCSGIAQAQIVNIPDANFKTLLLSSTPENQRAYGNGAYIAVDANANGEIELTEAQVIDSLDLDIGSTLDPHINSLTGISSFSNLKKLTANYHDQLSSLDVSSLTNLKRLELLQNNLTSLDVSMLPDLEYLRTEFSNNLASINVNGLANLKDFYCDYCALTSLDLSGLTSLRSFSCNHNQLATLNVSGSPNLHDFSCNSNQLTSLIFGNLPSLFSLSCGTNQLTSLDLANLPNLAIFDCYSNQLTTIDVSNLTGLYMLGVDDNQLTTLNLNGLNHLYSLTCSYNLFTTLDCSMIPLNELDCSNNPLLQSLFVKNGVYWNSFSSFGSGFAECTNLAYICADENEITTVNNEISASGLTGVVVNSYCSFTPGGDYNTIIGNIKFDANNNGCDVSDDMQPNIRVNINDGTNQGAAFTSTTGNYTFYTQEGSFDITSSIENPTLFTISPTIVTIPFFNNFNNVVTQDFCITANGVHPDVEVVISPIIWARPGFEAVYQITYRNKGNQTVNGVNTFTYDDTKMDFVSASQTPDLQETGALYWDFGVLQPFESRSFTVTMYVHSPTDSAPVNIGDQLVFNQNIVTNPTDENIIDNTFQYNQTVVGSFDPNDITCLEGDVVAPSEIGKYLHYIINFENTGTADAENIVVKDIIDTNKYNVSSLQVMDSSSSVTTKIKGNTVEFIFENINLQAAQHGNVAFKIKSRSDLFEGNTVSNSANIFFDYNAPVATNTANTTYQTLGTNDWQFDTTISVYPNPTHNVLNIKANNTITSVQLYDVQGRLLSTQLVNDINAILYLAYQNTGIYFLKVITDKGIKIEKIVKE